MTKANHSILLVYDGACPLCRTFGKAVRLREAVGELQLINARDNPLILNEINARGFNLDEGIVVKYNDKLYFGSDALQLIALLSTNQTWFNKITAYIFRSPFLSRMLYPFLRSLRNLLLHINGIKKINNLERPHE